MEPFDEVWLRIERFAGEEFRQVAGKGFTYTVHGGVLTPSTANRNLPRSSFHEAFERMPVDGPGKLNDLQGPSYLFAILSDPRICP
jgi:hypothetical protein